MWRNKGGEEEEKKEEKKEQLGWGWGWAEIGIVIEQINCT